MRRDLGERGEYRRYSAPLGRAVHYDAWLLLSYVQEPGFRFEGLGSNWLVELGRLSERSQLYPRDSLLDEIDARRQRESEVQRLLEAVERLREYDPVLHYALFACCVVGQHEFIEGRGLRHRGPQWERLLRGKYEGKPARLWAHLTAGWDFLAVLAVSPAVLAAAEAAGAASEKALRWCRGRGLLG